MIHCVPMPVVGTAGSSSYTAAARSPCALRTSAPRPGQETSPIESPAASPAHSHVRTRVSWETPAGRPSTIDESDHDESGAFAHWCPIKGLDGYERFNTFRVPPVIDQNVAVVAVTGFAGSNHVTMMSSWFWSPIRGLPGYEDYDETRVPPLTGHRISRGYGDGNVMP